LVQSMTIFGFPWRSQRVMYRDGIIVDQLETG
jgi:hypothetical protein